MTVGTDDCHVTFSALKVEFEEKNDANFVSHEDLVNADDFDRSVCDNVDGEKDSMDDSYVFVNRTSSSFDDLVDRDLETERVADLVEVVETGTMKDVDRVLSSNIRSSSQGKFAENDAQKENGVIAYCYDEGFCGEEEIICSPSISKVEIEVKDMNDIHSLENVPVVKEYVVKGTDTTDFDEKNLGPASANTSNFDLGIVGENRENVSIFVEVENSVQSEVIKSSDHPNDQFRINEIAAKSEDEIPAEPSDTTGFDEKNLGPASANTSNFDLGIVGENRENVSIFVEVESSVQSEVIESSHLPNDQFRINEMAAKSEDEIPAEPSDTTGFDEKNLEPASANTSNFDLGIVGENRENVSIFVEVESSVQSEVIESSDLPNDQFRINEMAAKSEDEILAEPSARDTGEILEEELRDVVVEFEVKREAHSSENDLNTELTRNTVNPATIVDSGIRITDCLNGNVISLSNDDVKCKTEVINYSDSSIQHLGSLDISEYGSESNDAMCIILDEREISPVDDIKLGHELDNPSEKISDEVTIFPITISYSEVVEAEVSSPTVDNIRCVYPVTELIPAEEPVHDSENSGQGNTSSLHVTEESIHVHFAVEVKQETQSTDVCKEHSPSDSDLIDRRNSKIEVKEICTESVEIVHVSVSGDESSFLNHEVTALVDNGGNMEYDLADKEREAICSVNCSEADTENGSPKYGETMTDNHCDSRELVSEVNKESIKIDDIHPKYDIAEVTPLSDHQSCSSKDVENVPTYSTNSETVYGTESSVITVECPIPCQSTDVTNVVSEANQYMSHHEYNISQNSSDEKCILNGDQKACLSDSEDLSPEIRNGGSSKYCSSEDPNSAIEDSTFPVHKVINDTTNEINAQECYPKDDNIIPCYPSKSDDLEAQITIDESNCTAESYVAASDHIQIECDNLKCPSKDSSLPCSSNSKDLGSASKIDGVFKHISEDARSLNFDDVKFGSFNGIMDKPYSSSGTTDLETKVHITTKEDDNKVTNSLDHSQSFLKDVSNNALDGKSCEEETNVMLPNFIIKVPRYVDENIQMQIKIAHLQVEEKTRERDSIRQVLQAKRVIFGRYREEFEVAKSEEKAAKNVIFSKRQEMDSVQTTMNKMRDATSISDIDDKIQSLDHRISHETMPLKEEKLLLREIKQLKYVREQLCANVGSQADIQELFDQSDSTERRSKDLRVELDDIRKNIVNAELKTSAAKRKQFDELENLKVLQDKFKAADDIRQKAYMHLQSLKKENYEKNKYFYMYKEDEKIATEHALARNREKLQQHCVNQVEKFMELWNKNDEFRRQYIKNNETSTIRRFKTLDGRSLGPGEEPIVLHKAPEEDKVNTVVPSIRTDLSVVSSTANNVDPKPSTKTADNKNRIPDSKKPKSGKKENRLVEISDSEILDHKEEPKISEEEQERLRKEEELRKIEAEAKVKEQKRLEERAKAKEAEERKRRKAEKAQSRAEQRALKEAEIKEKERQKKARKKEKKKLIAAEVSKDGDETEPTSNLDPQPLGASEEIKMKPKSSSTVTKRTPPKAKSMAIPPPLRARNKRKMQTWIWIILGSLAVLALFLLGNTTFYSNLRLSNFRF